MINKAVLNHLWLTPQADLLLDGFCFPKMVIESLLVTEKDKLTAIIENNKDKVLNFIKTKKRAYITEIAEVFGLNIINTKLILNLLETENKIKINQ